MKEDRKTYMKNYYQKNKEKFKEYSSRFLAKNPNYQKEYMQKRKSGGIAPTRKDNKTELRIENALKTDKNQ